MENKPATAFAESTTLLDYMFTGNTGGVFRRITSANVASQLYDLMGFGDAVTYDVGINGGLLVGNIGGNGVMRYDSGAGVHTATEGSAFNKNFGTAESTVARGNHDHNSLKNGCIGVWEKTGSVTATIDKTALETKMGYDSRNYINPAVNYKIWTRNDTAPYTLDDEELTGKITSKLALSATSGDYYEFDKITFTGLNATKTYMIQLSWIDDGGIFIANSGV